jgi:hypothetical protein
MPSGSNSSGNDNDVGQTLESLTPAELRELARKVYELFKRDLALERDRFGRSKSK